MRKCPNWTSYHSSVPGWWKYQLLQHLGQHFNLKTFIETGTCNGSACQHLAPYFDQLYTIELSEYYYREACERFDKLNLNNVIRFLGDSREWLPSILMFNPDTPTLFWLDAHSSGGLTADAGDPLAQELDAIMSLRPNALIVIDDMQNGELKHVEEAGVSLKGWTREYHTGEVIMYKEGLYKIPPFQEAE